MRGMEPIIAVVLIVAVTVALAIGVALWMTGVVNANTGMTPRLQAYGHIDPRGGGEFLVTVANKASVDATITSIYINNRPAEILGIEWGSRGASMENISGRLVVVVKPGGVAVIRAKARGMDFIAGTKYQVFIKTSSGYTFYTVMDCPVTVHYVDLTTIFTANPRLAVIDTGIYDYVIGEPLYLVSFLTGLRLPENYSSVTIYGVTLRDALNKPVAKIELYKPFTLNSSLPVYPRPGAVYLGERFLRARLVRGRLVGGRYSAAVDMAVNGERQEFIVRNVILAAPPKPLFVFINMTGYPGGWWLDTNYLVSYLSRIVGRDRIIFIVNDDQLYTLFYGSDDEIAASIDPRLVDPEYRVIIVNTHGEAFPIPRQKILNPPPGRAYTSRTCCPGPGLHVQYDSSHYYWNYTDIEVADREFMSHVDTSTGLVDKAWADTALTANWNLWNNASRTPVDYRPRYLLDVRRRIAEKGWILLMPSAYAFYYLTNQEYTNWGHSNTIHGLCFQFFGDEAILDIPLTEYRGHVQGVGSGVDVEPVAHLVDDVVWLLGDRSINTTMNVPRQIRTDIDAVHSRLAVFPGFPGYYYYNPSTGESAIAVFAAGNGYIILSGMNGFSRLHIRASVEAAIHFALFSLLRDL